MRQSSGYRVRFKSLRTGGSCCAQGTDATILRTYPTVLNHSNNVREAAWSSFCDEIDEVLKPVRRLKNQTLKMVASLVLAMIITLIATAALITQGNVESNLGPFWYVYIFSFIYLAPALAFCWMRRMQLRRYKKVYDDISAVCMRRSNQHRDVHFRLISERQTNGQKVWYVRSIFVVVAGVNDNDEYTAPTGTDVSNSEDDEFFPSPLTNIHAMIENRV